MKILRKTISSMVIILILMLIINPQRNIVASTNLNNSRSITNVGVLFYSLEDKYAQLIKQRLEAIQKENENNIKFTFYDGENNISIQYEMLDNILKSNTDLLVLDFFNVDESTLESTLSQIRQKNIPVVFLKGNPQYVSKISNYYNKAAILSADFKAFGMEQGKIIADLWNNNRNVLDKNGDNILNYIVLVGKSDTPIAKDITQSFESTINDFGIKSKKLQQINADWDREVAKSSISSVFLRYDGAIEAIVANNDSMAIGAVEALQRYGYNKGDKSKNVIVIGNDGIAEAKDLIDKGFMTATIIQKQEAIADAIYNVGMNLINNVNPIQNTNYKLEKGQIIVPIPYSVYK